MFMMNRFLAGAISGIITLLALSAYSNKNEYERFRKKSRENRRQIIIDKYYILSVIKSIDMDKLDSETREKIRDIENRVKSWKDSDFIIINNG